ncbi:uncharacterized protein DS421_17g580430 [Arachis hypogaea]|nr:uncharacterized protein DS421_17g580430 [Arachis hypogaea]
MSLNQTLPYYFCFSYKILEYNYGGAQYYLYIDQVIEEILSRNVKSSVVALLPLKLLGCIIYQQVVRT